MRLGPLKSWNWSIVGETVALMGTTSAFIYLWLRAEAPHACAPDASPITWWLIFPVLTLAFLIRFVVVRFDSGFDVRGLVGFAWYFTIIIIGAAGIYKVLGIHSGGAVPTEPATYLYFSLIAFSTVGFGDYAPCKAAHFVAALQGIMGVIATPLLVLLYSSVLNHEFAS